MYLFEFLKKIRDEKNITQNDVLFKLYVRGIKISRQTLINWEAGQTTPNANVAQALAEILGKPISFFFDDKQYFSEKVID